jgi:hypothetical protein
MIGILFLGGCGIIPLFVPKPQCNVVLDHSPGCCYCNLTKFRFERWQTLHFLTMDPGTIAAISLNRTSTYVDADTFNLRREWFSEKVHVAVKPTARDSGDLWSCFGALRRG